MSGHLIDGPQPTARLHSVTRRSSISPFQGRSRQFRCHLGQSHTPSHRQQVPLHSHEARLWAEPPLCAFAFAAELFAFTERAAQLPFDAFARKRKAKPPPTFFQPPPCASVTKVPMPRFVALQWISIPNNNLTTIKALTTLTTLTPPNNTLTTLKPPRPVARASRKAAP